eukprot:5178917-Amphidinium_carterae.2
MAFCEKMSGSQSTQAPEVCMFGNIMLVEHFYSVARNVLINVVQQGVFITLSELVCPNSSR